MPPKKRAHDAAAAAAADDSGDVASEQSDVLKRVSAALLTRTPNEVTALYAALSELDCANPRDALLDVIGARFVGPFDVLDVSAPAPKQAPWLRNRAWFDPPEVEPVAVWPRDAARRWYYYRDAPCTPTARVRAPRMYGSGLIALAGDLPEFVVEASDGRGGKYTLLSDTLFGACLGAIASAPASRGAAKARAVLSAHAAAAGIATASSVKCKSRAKLCVATTSSNLGVCVPMTGDVGYRPLSLGTRALAALLQKAAASGDVGAADAMVTEAAIASDEGDHGMGLHLGLELWAASPFWSGAAARLLETAYTLLGRDAFAEIVRAHAATAERAAGTTVAPK